MISNQFLREHAQRTQWVLAQNPGFMTSPEELQNLVSMEDRRARLEEVTRNLDINSTPAQRIVWIKAQLPFMPAFLQVQMAANPSDFFIKVASAARNSNLKPDFSILELAVLAYWRFGPTATVAELATALQGIFRYYQKRFGLPDANGLSHRTIPFLFKSPEGKCGSPVPLLQDGCINEHLAALFEQNCACAEPFFQCLGLSRFDMVPGHETVIFARFGLQKDIQASPYSSPIPLHLQGRPIPPPAMRFPAIKGRPYATIPRYTPTLKDLPFEIIVIIHSILEESRLAMQIKSKTFYVGSRYTDPDTLNCVAGTRMTYTDRTNGPTKYVHLPPFEVLFGPDRTFPHLDCHIAAEFFKHNTLDVTEELEWLRDNPRVVSLLCKVKLKLYIDPNKYRYDSYTVRLIGWIACSPNLRELALEFPKEHLRMQRDENTLVRQFRSVPAIMHLSKFRGVNVKVSCEQPSGILGLEPWLKAHMSQPKQAPGMTAYDGMATMGDVQALIEQEVEDNSVGHRMASRSGAKRKASACLSGNSSKRTTFSWLSHPYDDCMRDWAAKDRP